MTSFRSESFTKLPQSWASLEGSTLAARYSGVDVELLRNASILLPVLRWARLTPRKGLTYSRIESACGIGHRKLARLLTDLSGLGAVEYTGREKADPRIKWFRLTDNAQTLTDEAVTRFYKLPHSLVASLEQPTWLSLWVVAVRTNRPSLTTTEVASMLDAPRTSVARHFALTLAPAVAARTLAPGWYVTAETAEQRAQALNLLTTNYATTRADADDVYINGELVGRVARSEGRSLKTMLTMRLGLPRVTFAAA